MATEHCWDDLMQLSSSLLSSSQQKVAQKSPPSLHQDTTLLAFCHKYGMLLLLYIMDCARPAGVAGDAQHQALFCSVGVLP